MSDTALLPIHKGDNFILKATDEHFVCMGWESGRIRAMSFSNQGFFIRSMTVDALLDCGYVKFPSPEYDEWRQMRERQRLFRALEEEVWRQKQREKTQCQIS